MIQGTICGADSTTQHHLQAEKRGEINLKLLQEGAIVAFLPQIEQFIEIKNPTAPSNPLLKYSTLLQNWSSSIHEEKHWGNPRATILEEIQIGEM